MADTDTTQDFAEFLRQPAVISYLDAIFADAEKATDIADRNLAYRGLQEYPANLVSEYKSDKKARIDAEGAFNVEYTKVGSGAADSLDAFTDTYQTYLLALEVLELSNGDHSALVDADLGLKVAALVLLANEISPLALKLQLLDKKTNELLTQLIAANKKCKDKAIQATLTLPLQVLGAVVCPEALLARLAWRGGLAVTQTIINTAFAGTTTSKELTVAKGLGSTAWTVVSNLKKNDPTVMSSLRSLSLSVITNATALGMAVADAKKLSAELKAYMAMYQEVSRAFQAQTRDVQKVADEAEKAYAAAVRNIGRTTAGTAQRKKLLDEIKSYGG
jgi:hypothetical protein